MRIKFYLRDPDATAPTALFARISYHGKVCKVYPDKSIHPKNWNHKKQQARFTAAFEQATEFNEGLNDFISTVEKLWMAYRNGHSNNYPDPAIFKSMIEKKISHGEQGMTFIEYFEDFVTRTGQGKRINPRNSKPIVKGLRGYKATLEKLKRFQSKKDVFTFDSIDRRFYENFTSFLQAKPYVLSLNTIGSHWRRITTVMRAAVSDKVSKNENYKETYFVKQSESTDAVYLTNHEIKLLEELDLSANPRLERVRDFFLIGCYTGMRYSDLATLNPRKHTSDKYIHKDQEKTGKPIVIRITEPIRRIFKKYDWNMPQSFYKGKHNPISEQRLNDYIKEVCAMIPELCVPVMKKMTKGGKEIEVKGKDGQPLVKYEMISSHTARRSFVSNKVRDGYPTAAIMQQSGHSSEKMLMLYSKLSPVELADMMAEKEEEIKRKEIEVPTIGKKNKRTSNAV
jgi:integrase